MPRILQPAVLDAAGAELGEGPLWDPVRGALSWVDIPAGKVHVTSASGLRHRTYEIGVPVGAALPASGGWLLADACGFTWLDEDGRTATVHATIADAVDLRFNDAKCDPAGRAFAGTVAYDLTPGAGALYRLDPGPVATRLLEGLTVSNGLGWSPDAGTMWLADSPTRRLTAFDYDLATGTLGPHRSVLNVEAQEGVPDGLTVDDAGCLWVAFFGGGVVNRYTPQGRIDTVVRLPTMNVTSCTFGGAGLDTMFITTARRRLTPDQLVRQPQAGALFTVEPGITGPPATPWSRADIGWSSRIQQCSTPHRRRPPPSHRDRTQDV